MLDQAWLEILLCLIGESFGEEDGNIVNGAVVSIRGKGDKIGVWLGNAKLSSSIMAIGRALKERMCLDSQNVLGFEVLTHIFIACMTIA
jgi:translation initiation factor 4E